MILKLITNKLCVSISTWPGAINNLIVISYNFKLPIRQMWSYDRAIKNFDGVPPGIWIVIMNLTVQLQNIDMYSDVMIY